MHGPMGGPGSMEMCHQMMGEMMMHHMRGMAMRGDRDGMPGMRGMMGPMGMMGGMPADPKRAAQMMEMRGEMMKAMGEIMMKYGQRMQAEPAR